MGWYNIMLHDIVDLLLYIYCAQFLMISLFPSGWSAESYIPETFNCIVCQEVVYQHVTLTTTCSHNIRKVRYHSLEYCVCVAS